jgi:hypothetical protein
MSEEQKPSPKQPVSRGGVGLDAGRDVSVDGDVAGRDVVKTTTTTTTNVGFGPKEVQRLVLTVGALVFFTAACFFSGGALVGFGAVAALNRPVTSNNPTAAARFETALNTLRSLPPGQAFEFSFTEEEISSYFRLILAPTIGVSDGKVRLLDTPGQLVVGGQAESLGNLHFAATFRQQDTPGEPLKLTGMEVQVLSLRNKLGQDSHFGWVVVPTLLVQPLANNLNNLFGDVQLTDTAQTSPLPNPAWTVSGVTR